MPLQPTGLTDHEDYQGSTEQINGLPHAEKHLITGAEFNNVKNTIDATVDAVNALDLALAALTQAVADIDLSGGGASQQAITDAVDGLESALRGAGASNETLTALRTDVDALSTILQSDDTTLDTAQERIDRIKQLISDVENIAIADISGLQAALDAKEATATAAAARAAMQAEIDALELILVADDTDFDTAQERIDELKRLSTLLDGVPIANVAGLQGNLDLLQSDVKNYGPAWGLTRAQDGYWDATNRVATGSDGEGYVLTDNAINIRHPDAADTGVRDALTVAHGDVVFVTGDQDYRYDRPAAAWIAWNGVDPIAPDPTLNPVAGNSSWGKLGSIGFGTYEQLEAVRVFPKIFAVFGETDEILNNVWLLTGSEVIPFITSPVEEDLYVDELRLSTEEFTPEVAQGAVQKGVKRLHVLGHYHTDEYPDSIRRGKAVYDIGPAHAAPNIDGYVKFNIGTVGATLQIDGKKCLSGCWGIVGDSTDEHLKAKAFSEHAASIATADSPATAIIEAGAVLVANIQFGAHVQVWLENNAYFRGNLNSPSMDETEPHVIIGSHTEQSTGLEHRNISFKGQYIRGIADRNITGVRIVNLSHAKKVSFGRMTRACNILEIVGSGSNNTCANNVYSGGFFSAGRNLITFRSELGVGGDSNSGWLNQSCWVDGPTFHSGSEMTEEGSLHSIRFIKADGSYNGHNAMSFERCDHQIGMSGNDYAYPAGQSFLAKQRFNVDGREYMCEEAMTLPAGAGPTHTSGTVADITYTGLFRRQHLLLDGASGKITMKDQRSEGSYGEFVRANWHADGLNGVGLDLDISYILVSANYYPSDHNGEDLSINPYGRVSSYSGQIYLSATTQEKQNYFEASDLGLSAIYSSESSRYHSSRFYFIEYPSGNIGMSGSADARTTSMTLTRDGLLGTGVHGIPSVILDVENHKTFEISATRYNDEQESRLLFVAYDENMVVIPQSGTSVLTTINNTAVTPLANMILVPAGQKEQTIMSVVRGRPDVRYVAAGFYRFDLDSISIKIAQRSLKAYKQQVITHEPDPYIYIGNKQRASRGVPTYGHFTTVGEVINCAIPNDTRQWVVDEPGVVERPWSAGISIDKGQLVTNAGNTYYAQNSIAPAASNTASIAPVHTSGTVSDGVIDWTWFSKTPVITLRT